MVHAKKSLGQNFLNSKAVARDIVRAAELSSADTVLEIGPGKGFLTSELLATGAHIIAVEKDDRMIPILSEKFAEEIMKKQFVLIHGDIIEEKGSGAFSLELGCKEKAPDPFSPLTSELLATGAHIIAVEKDDRMIPILSEKFAEEITREQFVLIHGDIMDAEKGPGAFSLESRCREKAPDPFSRKLVANIPYYLTGQIIRIFLEAEAKPERMILMVQKEVATRIVARDKKESILSIAVKAYGTPRIIKKVPARYFTPAPKVDSAILAIENISGKNFADKKGEGRFFEIVRTGFAHKRKILAGNLKELFGESTLKILEEVGIAKNARAENLSLDQWLALSKKQPINSPLQ